MNRSYINRNNAQDYGYREGMKFLNSIFATTYEFYVEKGHEVTATLYSDVTRAPFFTGWMNAWEVRYAHESKERRERREQSYQRAKQNARERKQASSEQPKAEQPKTSTSPIFKFERTLVSALAIFDLPEIRNVSKRELISKYRELAKLHHPDHGGQHENMIAINLAFDYLKPFVF